MIEKLKSKKLIKISGGLDFDNNVQAFGDYYATLLEAKKYLKPPITIKSCIDIWECVQTGNNLRTIVIEFEDEDVIELLDFVKKKFYKAVVVNELDYILSRKWVKEWIIDDNVGDKENAVYIIRFIDDETIVETSNLTLQ